MSNFPGLELDSWVSSTCDGDNAESTGEVEVYVDLYIVSLN